jgi:hypothetical protein
VTLSSLHFFPTQTKTCNHDQTCMLTYINSKIKLYSSLIWWFQPLWRKWKSDWIIIPTIGGNKKCSKPPTRWCVCHRVPQNFAVGSLENHVPIFFLATLGVPFSVKHGETHVLRKNDFWPAWGYHPRNGIPSSGSEQLSHSQWRVNDFPTMFVVVDPSWLFWISLEITTVTFCFNSHIV